MQWTVDTWLLVRANEGEEPGGRASESFLLSLWEGGEIAINSEVEKEYKKKALKNENGFAAQWYSKMWASGRVDASFQAPEDEKASRFRKRLLHGLPKGVKRFDPDDIPFVVLCFRTDDRHLISGDVGEGDFSPKMTRWLYRAYKICFHDVIESAPFHRARELCTRAGEA